MKKTILMLGLAALILPATAQAEPLRGYNFINVVQRNTLSGTNADGVRFNTYFLPGGMATYQDANGVTDHGTWMLDKEGDVCVTWSKMLAGKQNCYQVSIDKSAVIWSNKDGSLHGSLLGAVEPLEMKAGQ
ncbi:hypothetical protein ACFPL7_18595 [Dongia soli]|uniref:Avidin family protein n=1 Tax=Dongia soli TaxID=600628 RepID=A0ABU5E6T7_9PROT|nr:hypothetical protein [Dongia soli]MDY0881602.1 hypothetical protein [Dongia soli]